MKAITNWQNIPETIDELFGFTYIIENKLTNQKYIGRKNFWAIRRLKQKNKKRRKVVTKESDWKTYKSSSKYVHSEIEKYGEENFTFKILKIYKSKSSLNYAETKLLIEKNTLFSKLDNDIYEYYNDQILNRYFRGKIMQE